MHQSAFLKNLVGLGQSHLALDQSQIVLNNSFQVGRRTRQLHRSRKIQLIRIKVRLPSTWVLLTRFGTMGTMSPGLDRKEQGGLPIVSPLSLRTWARKPTTEVV
jgi:hypothetical protein